MPFVPVDDNPAAVEGEATLIEVDLVPARITAVETRKLKMSDTEKAELDAYRKAKAEGSDSPAFVISQKQLSALMAVITTVITILGGGGYLAFDSSVEGAVDKQIDDSVADKVIKDSDAMKMEYKAVLDASLENVMVKVNKRIKVDQEAFQQEMGAIKTSVGKLDDRMKAQEKVTKEQAVTLGSLNDKLGNIGLQQKSDMKEILGAIRESNKP